MPQSIIGSVYQLFLDMNISITNHQHKISISQAKVKWAAEVAAKRLRLKMDDLSVVFVGAQRMRTINRTFLKHDYVTDVITFDLGAAVGEIIICPSVAASQARQYGNSVQREILLYMVHGLLHLAGYDDHAPADITRMRAKEKELMKEL